MTMVLLVWTILVVLYLYPKEVFSRTSCSINLNAEYRAQEEPLFLSPDGAAIIYPTNKASIEIQGGDKLRVYCGHRNFKELKDEPGDALLVQCLSGKFFKLVSPRVHKTPSPQPEKYHSSIFSPGLLSKFRPSLSRTSYEPKSFACQSIVKSATRPGGPCGLLNREDNHQEFSIGFPASTGFIPIISVCFDTELKSVLWSKHTVAPNVEHHMSKVPRIQFIQDEIPYRGTHLNVDRLYNRHQQIETIAALLGSKRLAEKYIEPKGNGFFARGHLAPKGDFVYAGEQLATFHFINVAPQWQYFNGGQWESIESTLRNYVIKNRMKASVLTLTLGISQLEDESGEDRDLYLYYNERTKDKLIKVPKLYAKIINFGNSSASFKSVVIVGVNQPYESHVKMSTNDIICQDVCDRYEWISGISQHNDQHHSSGYIYCCTPADFLTYLQSGQGYMLGSFVSQKRSDPNVEGFNSNEKTDSIDSFELKEKADSIDRFKLKENANSIDSFELKENADSIDSFELKEKADSIDSFKLKENADSIDSFELKENADSIDSFELKENADSIDSFGLNQNADSIDSFELKENADSQDERFNTYVFKNRGKDSKKASEVDVTSLIEHLSDFLANN